MQWSPSKLILRVEVSPFACQRFPNRFQRRDVPLPVSILRPRDFCRRNPGLGEISSLNAPPAAVRLVWHGGRPLLVQQDSVMRRDREAVEPIGARICVA